MSRDISDERHLGDVLADCPEPWAGIADDMLDVDFVALARSYEGCRFRGSVSRAGAWTNTVILNHTSGAFTR